jgi:hypothetical protein
MVKDRGNVKMTNVALVAKVALVAVAHGKRTR